MLGLGQSIAKSINTIWLIIKDSWASLSINFNLLNDEWDDI